MAVLDESRVAGFHHDAGPKVFIGGEIDVIHLWDHPVEKSVEGIGPFDALDPRDFAGAFLGEFFTLPDGDVFVGFADEEDFAFLGIYCVRHEDDHGFLLIDTREMEEIAVLFERHRAIRIGRIDIVRMNDDDAVGLEEAAKILTVADEKLGWNRFVTHGGTSSNRLRMGNPDFRISGEKALYPFGDLR